MTRHTLCYIALVLLLLVAGCKKDTTKDPKKWEVTLDHTDKKPYGTFLAYASLKTFYPEAKIEALSRGFRFSNMDDEMKSNYAGRNLIILEGMYLNLSDDEWEELKTFASKGNEVLIACSRLDAKVRKELNCDKEGAGEETIKLYTDSTDFANKDILSIITDPRSKFGYEGRSLKGYFTFMDDSDYLNAIKADSTITETIDTTATGDPRPKGFILGYASGKPNFMRYTIGEGHISVHAAPLAFSNYFLLQDGNEHYLTAILQTLPERIDHIYWHDFYSKSGQQSSMSILWKYPATRLALILAIIILLTYVLFESKRKQRIIPVVPPLRNDSVSFVETVGRLYYNKGDHSNLAEKMIQQFLEWVRSHYFLNTNQINENFIHQLIIKSGQPESTVRGLVDMIHESRLGETKTDDAYLYQLYTTIGQFYKNN